MWTAVVIVVILTILIVNIYPAKKDASAWSLGKLMIYSFIATFAVLSVHRGVIMKTVESSDSEKANDAIINSIGGDVTLSDGIEIVPSMSTVRVENNDAEVSSLIEKYGV